MIFVGIWGVEEATDHVERRATESDGDGAGTGTGRQRPAHLKIDHGDSRTVAAARLLGVGKGELWRRNAMKAVWVAFIAAGVTIGACLFSRFRSTGPPGNPTFSGAPKEKELTILHRVQTMHCVVIATKHDGSFKRSTTLGAVSSVALGKKLMM